MLLGAAAVAWPMTLWLSGAPFVGVLAMLSCVAVMLLPLVGVIVWLRGRRRQRFDLPPGRMERLRRLLIQAHSSAPIRFPHRVLEHAMREGSWYRSAVMRPRKLGRAGGNVVLFDVADDQIGSLAARDLSFEPVALARHMDKDDRERLSHLHGGMVGRGVKVDDGFLGWRRFKRDTEPGLPIPFPVLVASILLLFLVVIPSLTIRLVQGEMTFSLWWMVLVLASVFGGLVFSDTWDVQWWLIPGGIVRRRRRPWIRRERLKRYNACDSLLCADARTGLHVVDGESSDYLAISEDFFPAVLAGWLSTARPPTDEQLRDVLGVSPDRADADSMPSHVRGVQMNRTANKREETHTTSSSVAECGDGDQP